MSSPKDVIKSLRMRVDDGIKALTDVLAANEQKAKMIRFVSSLIADVVRSDGQNEIASRAGVVNVNLNTIATATASANASTGTGSEQKRTQSDVDMDVDDEQTGKNGKANTGVQMWVSGASHHDVETPKIKIVNIDACLDPTESFIILNACVQLIPDDNDDDDSDDDDAVIVIDVDECDEGSDDDMYPMTKSSDSKMSMFLSLCVRGVDAVPWKTTVRRVRTNNPVSGSSKSFLPRKRKRRRQPSETEKVDLCASLALADAMTTATDVDDTVIDVWIDMDSGYSQYIRQFTVGSILTLSHHKEVIMPSKPSSSSSSSPPPTPAPSSFPSQHIVCFLLRGEHIHVINDIPFVSKLFTRGQHTVCVTARVTDGVQLRCLTVRLQHAVKTRLKPSEKIAIQPVPYMHPDTAIPIVVAQRNLASEVQSLRRLAANGQSIGFTNEQIIDVLRQQRDSDEALGLVAEMQLDF